jgi:hypothetical protein
MNKIKYVVDKGFINKNGDYISYEIAEEYDSYKHALEHYNVVFLNSPNKNEYVQLIETLDDEVLKIICERKEDQ